MSPQTTIGNAPGLELGTLTEDQLEEKARQVVHLWHLVCQYVYIKQQQKSCPPPPRISITLFVTFGNYVPRGFVRNSKWICQKMHDDLFKAECGLVRSLI